MRSATIRQLMDVLERTDIVVYVEDKALTHYLHGQMIFVGRSGGFRYLRVSIRITAPRANRMATLAHELQHALEVAQAPEVIDDRTLGELYERIGYRNSYGWETRAARTVATQASMELAVTADASAHENSR